MFHFMAFLVYLKTNEILWTSLQFHADNPMNKQQQQTNLIWRRSIPFFVFYSRTFTRLQKKTNWWMTNSKRRTCYSLHSNDKWSFQFSWNSFIFDDWEINYITQCIVTFRVVKQENKQNKQNKWNASLSTVFCTDKFNALRRLN